MAALNEFEIKVFNEFSQIATPTGSSVTPDSSEMSNKDKENIAAMPQDKTKYAGFPDGMSDYAIETFMVKDSRDHYPPDHHPGCGVTCRDCDPSCLFQLWHSPEGYVCPNCESGRVKYTKDEVFCNSQCGARVRKIIP